jgi:hypothetical protein
VGDSYLFAINDAGQSVGNSTTANGQDAVLWSPSGKAKVLQDAGRQHDSRPISINDAGWSVGYSLATSAGNRFDAALWSPSGKAKVLEDPGDRGISFANVHQRRGAGRWRVLDHDRLRRGAVVVVGKGEGA